MSKMTDAELRKGHVACVFCTWIARYRCDHHDLLDNPCGHILCHDHAYNYCDDGCDDGHLCPPHWRDAALKGESKVTTSSYEDKVVEALAAEYGMRYRDAQALAKDWREAISRYAATGVRPTQGARLLARAAGLEFADGTEETDT